MMKDDAIAPVIAVMLILAAVVTVYSIWNAVYVPAEKESSEIEHLKNVGSAFQHFSSELEFAVSSHQNHLSFSEPVQLGGGDVSVNLLKSSGTLQVQENQPLYYITFATSAGNMPLYNDKGPFYFNGTMVNFSYEPTNNFWQEQGYRWQNGYINVTKYGSLQTPLGYYNMTDIVNEVNTTKKPLHEFAQSFMTIAGTQNLTPIQNISINTDTNRYNFTISDNCDGLDIWAVNLSVSPEHPFTSGNGYGKLTLTSKIGQYSLNDVTLISLGSDKSMFGNQTIQGVNASFSGLNKTICNKNVMYNTSSIDTRKYWDIQQDISPVNVTIHMVNIEIGAY
jgi:hypothetical protein